MIIDNGNTEGYADDGDGDEGEDGDTYMRQQQRGGVGA